MNQIELRNGEHEESVCVCVCMCEVCEVCERGVCVCVCVCVRERESGVFVTYYTYNISQSCH